MKAQDVIVTALTPGSPFNPKGKIYRSVKSLAAITGYPAEEIFSLLAGDLAALVACKPSNKGKGLLVALKAQLPAAPVEQVLVAGGNAFVPPAPPLYAVDGAGGLLGLAPPPIVPGAGVTGKLYAMPGDQKLADLIAEMEGGVEEADNDF